MEALIDDRPAQRSAQAILHSGYIVAGAVTIILGPMLPILIARWSMSDEDAGLFFTLQFGGNLLGIASLSPLISRRGYGQTLGVGFACMALGTAALSLGPEFVGFMATAAFGYGLGLILPGANLWVAEVAGSRRAAALSLLNLAWGLGAISCPALVIFAQRSDRLRLLLLGIAGLSGCVALALVALDIEPRSKKGAATQAFPAEPTVGMKTSIALGGLFFLYCGTESAIGGWTAAFAKRMGTTSGNLWELAPMFFWAGLLTGRALGPLILHRVAGRAVLIGGLILACVCNGALLWVAEFRSAAVCLVVCGLGCACVYPLLLASLIENYGERARRIGSVIFALAALGGATIPWLVGFTSTHTGSLRAGLTAPLVAGLFMLSLLRLLPGPSAADRLTGEKPDQNRDAGDS